MDLSVYLGTFLFLGAMVIGFIALKFFERRLGLVRLQQEEGGDPVTRPPVFSRMDDVDYVVDWFVRRDPWVQNPLLLRMNIVDNLAEETKVELDSFMANKYLFGRYLGERIDFLPRVEKAGKVLEAYYLDRGEEGFSQESMENIKSYARAKIRILGWLYFRLYGKFYNQREHELLDFTGYYESGVEAGEPGM